MTDHKRRLSAIEDKAGGAELPYLPLKQSLDDPLIYQDAAGNTYHESDFEALGQRYNLIIIEYTHEWRSDGSEPIRLRWPDDD